MVLFWLMWFCLALWGAARLLSAEGRVGLRLALATGTARPAFLRRAARAGGRWPPIPWVVPRAGPPGWSVVRSQ